MSVSKLFRIPSVIGEVPAGMSLTELLPGVNAATIFASASDETRFDLVRSLARSLQLLHSLAPGEGIIGELHYSNIESKPSTDEKAMDLQFSPTHCWFRRLVHILIPLVHEKLNTTLHSSDMKASEMVTKTDETLRFIGILKSYADLPASDPYWTSLHRDKMVFIHGDFMLPNILVAESSKIVSLTRYAVTGLVDWGDAGLGDARYDVWSCMWSIKLNAQFAGITDMQGQELATAFLEEYYAGLTTFMDDFSPWEALYEIWEYVSFS